MNRILYLTGWLATACLCLGLILASPVRAAQFAGEDVFVLPADAVVAEDLFVTGREIIIEGTVQGDLFAAGSTVLIQGEVLGTAYIAAYAIVIQGGDAGERGIVHGDLMAASYSLIVDGEVGQDIRSATGGAGGVGDAGVYAPNNPLDLDNTSLQAYVPRLEEGLVLTSRARVNGDVLAAAGIVTVEGTVARDLSAATGLYLQADTASIGGDLQVGSGHAELHGRVEGDLDVKSSTIVFGPALGVGGATSYAAVEPSGPPGALYTPFQDSPDESPTNWRAWLLRTLLVVVGFGLLLGLLRLFPRSDNLQLSGPRLGNALVWGILSLFLVPMAIVLIPALTGLFLGLGNALVVAGLILAVWCAVWIFSPLVAGRSLGRWLRKSLPGEKASFGDDLLGVALVVLAIRLGTLPDVGVAGVQAIANAVGWLALSLCYLLAMGSLVQGWNRGRTQRLSTDADAESSRVPA